MTTSRTINLARWLLLANLVALLTSTSLAIGVEFLLYLSFAVFPSLRSRLLRSGSQPMVLMLLAWGAVLIMAGFYSVATAAETLATLFSWRRLLLLPMAAAVFDDDIWKRRLVWTLVLTATLGVLLSYFSWFSGILIYRHDRGIAIHNRATQGMIFAVSLFAIALLSRYARPVARGWRWFLLGAGLLIFANLIFITPGRSGYLVLLVLIIVVPFFLMRGSKRFILAVTALLLVGSLLLFSPIARQRIVQGFEEMRSHQTASQPTDMGVRMVVWQNTLASIKERPWLGYGTGGFSEAYRRQVAGQEGWRGQGAYDPHNQFLGILSEQGILGLLVFLLFIGALFRQPVRGMYRVLGLGVVLAWCATSMFSSHFSTFVESRFLYLWCGALLVPSVAESEDTE